MTLRLEDPKPETARATAADRMLVMIIGLVLLGVGVAIWTGNPGVGVAIPGAVLTAASLGLTLRR